MFHLVLKKRPAFQCADRSMVDGSKLHLQVHASPGQMGPRCLFKSSVPDTSEDFSTRALHIRCHIFQRHTQTRGALHFYMRLVFHFPRFHLASSWLKYWGLQLLMTFSVFLLTLLSARSCSHFLCEGTKFVFWFNISKVSGATGFYCKPVSVITQLQCAEIKAHRYVRNKPFPFYLLHYISHHPLSNKRVPKKGGFTVGGELISVHFLFLLVYNVWQNTILVYHITSSSGNYWKWPVMLNINWTEKTSSIWTQHEQVQYVHRMN